MLTCTDENLVACELVAAIGLWFGFGAQQPQVGAAMRLGQTHGAGPLATRDFGQVHALLFF